MLSSCIICSDVFDSSSEVFVTPCGHLFHYTCVLGWLERSRSCPQCRNKTTEKTIHRVYFNTQNTEGAEDVGALQNNIENLKLKIQLKESDSKHYKEEVEKLTKQNKNLREEVRNLETKLTSSESNIVMLKDQIRYLKVQLKNSDEIQEECRRLRNRLDTLKNVETVVHGTVSEVEEMLNSYCDSQESQKSIAIYASVLKRELQAACDKRKELRNKLKSCQSELAEAIQTKNTLANELQAKLAEDKDANDNVKQLESENLTLKRKIKKLEEALVSQSPAGPQASAIRRLIAESPAPESIVRPKLTDPSESLTEDFAITSPTTSRERSLQYRSLFKTNSTSTATNRNPATNNMTEFSIFKKTRLDKSSETVSKPDVYYDGLGGHSRLDEFPVPKPSIKAKNKFKLVINGKRKW